MTSTSSGDAPDHSRAEPGAATARALAGRLRAEDWREAAAGVAYRSIQTRFRVAVDRNDSPEALRLVAEEAYASADGAERRMAEDLLAVIRDELSLSDLGALTTVFGEALITAAKHQGTERHMDEVFGTLERLLEKAASR